MPSMSDKLDAARACATWLIWSNEHDAWWKPCSLGYTRELSEAGLYCFDQAKQICDGANRWQRNMKNRREPVLPNEVMVPVGEALDECEVRK